MRSFRLPTKITCTGGARTRTESRRRSQQYFHSLRSGGGAARFRVRTSGTRPPNPRARFAPRSCSGSLSLADRACVPRPRHAPLHHAAHGCIGRRSHRLRHSCRRSCGARLRVARHCLAQCAPQRRPLNRRGGSAPPGSPASISRPPVQRQSGFRPAGAGFGVTPHASVMQRAHARVLRALAGPLSANWRPPMSASCWTECMLWSIRA